MVNKPNPYTLAKLDIKDCTLDMCVGETRTIHCPFCGVTHEQTCSITKEQTGILYHCFRAKCKSSGFIPLIDTTKRVKERKQKQRPFTRPLKVIPQKLAEYLYRKYNFTAEDIDRGRFKYDYTQQRLYMPIITEDGYERGAVCKRLVSKQGSAKTLNYFWSPLCNLHIADSCVIDGPVVVVEDILSATKVARYSRCAALLGTHMSDEQAKRLQLLSTKLIVALDADTWDNSSSIGHKMKHRYGLLFEDFSVVRLSRDPKDMTDDEIQEVILGN